MVLFLCSVTIFRHLGFYFDVSAFWIVKLNTELTIAFEDLRFKFHSICEDVTLCYLYTVIIEYFTDLIRPYESGCVLASYL